MAGTIRVGTIKNDGTGTPPSVVDSTNVEVGTFCRAWINYNGITPATRGSFNISSTTRNATGDYSFNLNVSFSDTNYSLTCISDPTISVINNESRAVNYGAFAVGVIRIYTYSSYASLSTENHEFISFNAFR